MPKSPVKIQARPYIRAFVENCPYNARIFVILPVVIITIGSIENTWLIQILLVEIKAEIKAVPKYDIGKG